MHRYANLLLFPLFVWLMVYTGERDTTVERPDLTQEQIEVGLAEFGDIVDVRDEADGFCSKELKTPADGGKYGRVRITNKTIVAAKKYQEKHMDGKEIKTDHRYKLLKSAIPIPIRTQINETGVYEGLWSEIKEWVYDKDTGSIIP